MIYTCRPRPWARLAEWRLEDDTLSGAVRPHRLVDLRSVRIARGDGRYAPDALTVRLSFRTGAVDLSSLSFRDRLSPTDQTPELAAFTEKLLARAALLAPSARYETGKSFVPGLFLGAAAILGAGILAVLLATLAAGSYALGLELAARLSFVLILMFALWPWIAALGLRRFDPAAIPPGLLS